MAAKIFEVDDVLPATTQLKIDICLGYGDYIVYTVDERGVYIFFDSYTSISGADTGDVYIEIGRVVIYDERDVGPSYQGSHIVDTSNLSLDQRTIKYVAAFTDDYFMTWEDLNAPAPTSYTITFNSNGGSSISPINDATELPNPLPIPTKENHSFLGWYYDSDFTNEAFADDPLTSDVTLYAKWELNTYTITYNSNGGSSVPQTSNATQLPNPLPIPTKSGYTFVNWYYDSAFTQIANPDDPLTSDVTLYAKWELNTYTITFEENGGTTITDIEEATELPNPLPIPIKENHTFLGWYYDSDFTNEAFAGDPLTSNVTLYAKWELNTYTITFEENGGTTIPDIEEATELPDPLPIPTKSGYTFVNWYYDSAFTQKANAGDTLESNVTLYAKWELNTYTITYNSNGGSSISQTSDVTQLPSELPIPTKAHNTFVGWYYDSTLKQKAKPNDTINTNVTLYAKWYDSLSTFYTDIANLIREFENSSDNIKVIDFADRLRALLESV